MQLHFSTFDSPLGELLLATDAQGSLSALDFAPYQAKCLRLLRLRYGQYVRIDSPLPACIAAALRSYFEGHLRALESIRVVITGSELQCKVWTAIRAIPAGASTSYGELAKSLGYRDPRMAIEVGAALGSNPIALVVPCHRVIAKDGGMKGYAGGVTRKRWLLEHERAISPARAEMAQSLELRLPGI